MKLEILVLTPIYAPTLAELEREYTVHKLWTAGDPDAYLREQCAKVRGAVTTGLMRYNRSHLEALPKLEIIAVFGEGGDGMDVAAAKARGVVVTNTPGVTAESVADLAFGLMFAVMRRICEADRFVRAGKWPQGAFPMGRELPGKKVGIVGLGKIGRGIAKRAEAFGMSVGYHGRREQPGVDYRYYPGIENLARDADCLVIACRSTPETRGLVNARVLAALGPEGFLINIARGPVVDEQALIAALREKRIAGAGLDVYWNEPQVPADLTGMENVVLLPHIGSSTREMREERGRLLLANLRAHFAGRPVLTPVE